MSRPIKIRYTVYVGASTIILPNNIRKNAGKYIFMNSSILSVLSISTGESMKSYFPAFLCIPLN